MAFLAVEGAIDDIAGVRQGGRQLPIEIGVVLYNEQAQIKLRLAVTGERAFHGVDGDPSHFAIAGKNCQYVDEPVMAVA
jgi:hypothetical protein